MKGTLIKVCKDDTTSLSYGHYLIKYKGAFWIAVYDMDHNVIVQVQEAELSADRIPVHVQELVKEWLV